jgi:hypothetical protein
MKTLSLFIVVADLALCSFGQTNLDDVHSRSLTFKPDYTLGSSGLNEWKKIGAGDWRAQNDDIVGRPGSDGACGLLMSERSFQDVAVNTQFKCAAGAEIGFVFRLEKTSDGWKGVLVSLKDGEISDYAITFDTNGKELKRDELKAAGGNVLARLALPPAGDAAPARSGGNGGRNRGRRDEVSDSPLKRPDISYRSNDWNQIEVFLDLNVVRSFFNDGNQTAVGVVDETAGRYGPIALFVGGTGEVRFRDIAYKDLAARMTPLEQTSPHLRAQRVSDMYYSWGAAAADFNKDGVMDIVAGPYIYFGPGFTNYCEIFPAFPFNPSKEFTDVNCEYAFDFTGDGWPDVLTGPPNATLYVNPKGESRRWDKYVVVPGIQTEVTVLKDIDGSGMPALIYGKAGRLCYAKPDPANPTKFIEHAISGPGYSMAHGIGVGDINGDGRMDILNPNGWWEQPATNADQVLWPYHPQAFGRYAHRSWNAGGAAMAVYDVNGDGLNDVVTGLNAHGFGLAWFEQKRDASGNISFIRHMISDDYSAKNAGDVTFSQPHGSTSADLDGDGVPDFIVGKRYWSHLDVEFDPDPYGAPVLYWYRTVRNPKAPGGAEFIPEMIHNRSGAGSDITAVDLNNDGAIDIITSTDRGTFIFWNTMGAKK